MAQFYSTSLAQFERLRWNVFRRYNQQSREVCEYCDRFLTSAVQNKNDGAVVLVNEFARVREESKQIAYAECLELIKELDE